VSARTVDPEPPRVKRALLHKQIKLAGLTEEQYVAFFRNKLP